MFHRTLGLSASLLCLSLFVACEEDDTETDGTGGTGGSAGAETGGGSSTGGSSGDVTCAELCGEKSLGCPNDGDCLSECADFRSVCTEEADAVIACNYSRPSSDFQCNAAAGITQIKPGICATEQSAYNDCCANQ